MRAKNHPQFSTRLPESSDETLDEILEELRSQLELDLDGKVLHFHFAESV